MSGKPKIYRVVIVDDQNAYKLGFADMLGTCEEVEVVGKAGSAESAYREVVDKKPDVVMLDLWLDRSNENAGIDLIPRIREVSPLTGILAMSAYEDLLKKAAAAGADKIYTKIDLNWPEEITRAISDTYEHCRMREAETPPEVLKAFKELTEREVEVLRLMCSGTPNKTIAQELNIALRTVKNYTGEIYSKLGVTNRTEAAALVHKYKLLDI